MPSVKKLKRLLPSLREKKHYLVLVVDAKDRIESSDRIDSAIHDYLGVLGYSKASPVFISFTPEKSKAILAVNRKQVNDVKAGLLLAGIRCIGVSGTIKKAREKFLG